jgi:CRISPR system Cascade subunit CasE
MFLSKVQLRNDTKLASIAPLLSPANSHERVGVSHRLIWTLFDSSERETADFLWREVSQNVFYVLSERRPATDGVLDVATKTFKPSFQKGQRLSFVLRVNATVSQAGSAQKKKRGHRESLLTKVIREMNANGIVDPEERQTLIHKSVSNWMSRQGADIFSMDSLSIQGENNVKIPYKGKSVIFDFLDIEGELTVSNPEEFAVKILTGFGRTKAFGCGLMLVKPIR